VVLDTWRARSSEILARREALLAELRRNQARAADSGCAAAGAASDNAAPAAEEAPLARGRGGGAGRGDAREARGGSTGPAAGADACADADACACAGAAPDAASCDEELLQEIEALQGAFVLSLAVHNLTAAAVQGPEGCAAHVVACLPHASSLPGLDLGMREMLAAREAAGRAGAAP
jgi:hypothetical protein